MGTAEMNGFDNGDAEIIAGGIDSDDFVRGAYERSPVFRRGSTAEGPGDYGASFNRSRHRREVPDGLVSGMHASTLSPEVPEGPEVPNGLHSDLVGEEYYHETGGAAPLS